MLIVESIAKIRRMHHVDGTGFKTIAKKLNLSKNTVKEIIKSNKTRQKYKRTKKIYPALEGFKKALIEKLEFDKKEPKKRRRTSKKLFEELEAIGYKGKYGAVNNFVNEWKLQNNIKNKNAFVPLSFDPGESFQFDWSTEKVILCGEPITVKISQIRLCYSRIFIVIAYLNEKLEMVMDAHDKSFRFFEGVCREGIYDNMKTVVKKILIGKNRKFNEKFMEMASHYLFKLTACTPAAGWEKGQVENQVGTTRRNFFVPTLKANSLEELNKLLEERCLAWAKKTKHPEFKDQTVWEIYQKEKNHLLPYKYPFEACRVLSTTVSPCCMVNFDTNRYSVECEYVYQEVEIKIYPEKIIILRNDKVIGEHKRSFEKNKPVYNPWHYVPILERKPGALRNGAPFKELFLPEAMKKVQQILSKKPDGDKEFIKILLEVKEHGLEKVNSACSQALSQGICNADLIVDRISQCKLSYASNNDCNCYNEAFLKRIKK